MKNILCLSAMGLALSVVGTSTAVGQNQVITDPSLRAFLPKFEEGTSRFMNGDPRLWKEHASKRDDVTIVGGWGAYERGWKEVEPRYEWAAARFKESGAKANIEYVSSFASGDLAYTVSIERATVRIGDQPQAAPMTLRVTHIFRKEDGAWKLIHRHADPLMGKTAPKAVLQQ